MKRNKAHRFAALTLTAMTLLAGCGNDVPSNETSVPELATEQTQYASTTGTSSTKTSSAGRTTASADTTQTSTVSATDQTSHKQDNYNETETEPVYTNAAAKDNKPYSPGIENPPEGSENSSKPSGGQSSISTKATTSRHSPAVTTTKAPVKPVRSVSAEEMLDEMTLHEKVCQMFMAAPEGLTGYSCYNYADDHTYSCYDKYPIGGFIFFANNIVTSDQTRKMLSDLQNYAKTKGTGVFLATDEEGGKITRVCYKLGAPKVYDMKYYGSLGDLNEAFRVGTTIGTYLKDYGFNVDFAPVADVNLNPYNELGDRIFSTDPDVVASMSGAVVEGLQSKGVSGTLKHFPGLGAGGSNTHYGTVIMDRTYEQMRDNEFVAFSGGIDAGCDFVMVGHQVVTGAGDNMPADLSKVIVTDWLKGDLGFDGIIITDAQAMGAIVNVYGSSEAAVLSVEAGIDIILMPADLASAVGGVEQAVRSGRISEERIDESVLKILKKKESAGLLS